MPNLEEERAVTRKSSLAYAAVISFALSTVTLLGIGWALDRWLDTSPWLVITGIVLGASVGFYQFIKLLSRIGGDDK